jgi:mannitol/fructose-specific phosphotransferase system IIA component (Ntr-type)
MLLGEILHRSVIQPNLASTDRWDAIDELIELLVRADDLTPAQRDTVRDVVRAREEAGGSAMGNGVALPHGTTDRVENIVGALGIAPAGIDFGAHDGEPARLIILLVIPRNEFQSYVRDLAGIAHLLDEPKFRDELMAARDADTVLKLVRREEHGSDFMRFLQRFGWRR